MNNFDNYFWSKAKIYYLNLLFKFIYYLLSKPILRQNFHVGRMGISVETYWKYCYLSKFIFFVSSKLQKRFTSLKIVRYEDDVNDDDEVVLQLLTDWRRLTLFSRFWPAQKNASDVSDWSFAVITTITLWHYDLINNLQKNVKEIYFIEKIKAVDFKKRPRLFWSLLM